MKLRLLLPYAFFCIALYAGEASFMFWIAGTTRLPFFWAVFISQLILSLVSLAVLDPELLRERTRPAGKDLDKLSLPLLVTLLVAQLVVAARDVGKWHVGDCLPAAVQILAFILQVAGWLGMIWAMLVNRFFSSAIRIQNDRGQTVISTGPYAWMRHPGYVFASLALVCQGVALGSWLSLIPAILIVLVLLKRTILEEKMLVADLPGYTDYAQSVRYRWIPGVW
jgi:protein-S-isoprenylcysteine O-methyltransferase Ste14